MPIIDTHVHALPSLVKPETLGKWGGAGAEQLARLRSQARELLSPVSTSLHYTQTLLRHLPEGVRRRLDQVSGVAPMLGLLVESTATDLLAAMDKSGVDQAWVIAHPPAISNEFVMDLAAHNPRLLAVVNIPLKTQRPVALLKSYVKHGAKALKLHPASDGVGPDSVHYKKLIKTAEQLGLPVIIHTGCIHSQVLYKDPQLGHADRFIPWFKAYPSVRFILAHMNYHEPQVAFDLAEEYPNLLMDTSWQPAEVISEAVRRLGAERILFGSDWPFVGGNLSVGLSRIQDCVDSAILNAEQAKLILGENAAKLLNASA